MKFRFLDGAIGKQDFKMVVGSGLKLRVPLGGISLALHNQMIRMLAKDDPRLGLGANGQPLR